MVDNVLGNATYKLRIKSIEHLDRLRKMMLALPIEKLSRIPWGYKPSESDPMVLVADEKKFKLLLLAKEYLKQTSLRTVSAWLSKEGNEPMTHEALRKLMALRCPDDRCLLPLEEREKI